MPTGYTYKVQDGTMTSAKDFLLDYAKRFGIGYFITKQGELPMPKKYSQKLVEESASNYHTKRLECAKKDLESFNKLSDQELKAMYAAYVSEKQKNNEIRSSENLIVKQRYIDMINKVSKWNAPAGLEEMKASAISHLEESKEFDCKLYLEEIEPYDKWLEAKRKSLTWDVNYHTKEKAKEDERRVEMDTMLKAFYKSLDDID